MKKPSYINKALLQVAIVATVLLMVSCNTQNRNDSKATAEERNDEKFDDQLLGSSDKENDAQFLVNAAEINLEEIELGKLAQQKGLTTDVKNLGKMMEEAHTKSLNDLRSLAQRKMISLPTSSTEDAKEAYQELNEETGGDFDKSYADKMVNEHEDVIESFEDASEDSNDADIKNWAISALPALRNHLAQAKDCQNNLMAYNSQNN